MTCAAVYWSTTKSYKDIFLTTQLMRYNLTIYTTRMRHDKMTQSNYQIKWGKKWQMSFFIILLFYETLTNRSSVTFVTTVHSGGTVCQGFWRSEDDVDISRTSAEQPTVQANPSVQRGKLNMHSRKNSHASCSLCVITYM